MANLILNHVLFTSILRDKSLKNNKSYVKKNGWSKEKKFSNIHKKSKKNNILNLSKKRHNNKFNLSKKSNNSKLNLIEKRKRCRILL